MPAHFGRVEPVKVRRFALELRCDSLAVVGYRRRCSCGWSGAVRSTLAAARGDRCPEAAGSSSAG